MSTLRLGWRWAALRNGFLDATAYRVEFLIEVLGQAVVPVITQLVLWYAVFKLGGATEMAGLSYSDLILYTLTSILFSQIRGGDHDFELAEMIRTGTLSNYLLRPAGAVEFVYIRGSAPKLFLAGVCLVVGMIVGAIFGGIHPERMPAAMLMAFIGNIIHYQISAAIASIAFYWEEAYSVLMVKNLFVSLLSGELIHLGIFPEKWKWVWESFPFYLYVFGPVQYALGKWTHVEFFRALALSLVWLAVGWALVRISWGIGTRRYLSLGG